jgi:predicted Fe-S protein YdhL (DUF1289 family)
MRDLNELFDALARSAFRQRQRLGSREVAYIAERGVDSVIAHARDLVARRLAPAEPANDGKQTPFKGHPVFIAQHATATCCRGCLEKWHGIPKGRALTPEEQDQVVAVLARWLRAQEIPSNAREQMRLL